MTHIRSKTTNAHHHVAALIVANVARQVEELQRLLQRDAVYALAFLHRRKARLLVRVGFTNLNKSAVAANLGVYVLARGGVLAQQTLAAGAFRVALCLQHIAVERLVKLTNHLSPSLSAVGNVVKVLLHLGREVVIHNIRKVLHKELVHYGSDVGGEQLALLGAQVLNLLLAFNLLARLQGERGDVVILRRAVFLDDIFALQYRRYCRRVGRRTSYAEVLEFLHQACLRVARRMLSVVLTSLSLGQTQVVAVLHRGQYVGGLLRLLVVGRLQVHLQKSVKQHLLATASKAVFVFALLAVDVDVDGGLLQFGVGHLRRYGAFPYQLVQTSHGWLGGDVGRLQVGGTYCLVGLLGAFYLGVVAACFDIFSAVGRLNLLLGHIQSHLAQVRRVGTHVGDKSRLIQLLCYLHGACHRVSQLAAGFLLQRRCCERRCRASACRLGFHVVHSKSAVAYRLQELHSLLLAVKAAVQVGDKHTSLVGQKMSCDLEIALLLEVFNLLLALHDEAYGDALHTAGAQGGLYLCPQYGAYLVTHQAVKHAACLLRVDQTHVYVAGILYGVEYGVFRNLVKDNTFCLLGFQVQRFAKVPCYGLSLAVLIACQPHHVGVLRCFLQLCYKFVFLFRYLVFRFVVVFNGYAELLFGQIANVAVARHHGEVLSQELLNGLSLGGRLNDDKILHI